MPTTQIQLRRGTAAEWTAANPVLASGELGFETDTYSFKLGDGATAWNDLAYYTSANTQVFDTPGADNWTKPPGATTVEVLMWNGGSGGASGDRQDVGVLAQGGYGGNGGPMIIQRYEASSLTNNVALVVGAGGAGHAADAVNDTTGGAGTAGGASSFGAYLDGAGGWNDYSASGSPPSFELSVAGGANRGAAGGGASGGGVKDDETEIAGAAGGAGSPERLAGAVGGAAGAIGGNGGAGTSRTSGLSGDGGGSGGGSASAAGGTGGAGGQPGGGGGGGGASRNGHLSGAGGAGGAGMIIVRSW